MNIPQTAVYWIRHHGSSAMSDLATATWFHGSPVEFEAFDIDESRFPGFWFSSKETEALSFGRDRARVPQHNPKRVPVYVYEARIEGRIKVVDLQAIATEVAADNGLDAPETWDDVAEILVWGTYQRELLRQAEAEG